MEIPSGILCRAIPIDKLSPKETLALVEINVVIPSGILCKISTIIDIIPNLYKLLLDIFSSIFLSILFEKQIPITTKIITINIVGRYFISFLIRREDSGIRENIDILIITPAEKARDDDIIFDVLKLFI